ncbi:M56 family metallopeptidase [Winogradskyella sp. PAMC22761]|nr:M56 family metallopeptidase [Winogradskyella sp. PAMC22761]
MAIYILKFSACLFVFWIVYFLFLERQQMHHFKRFYLLSVFVLAIVIPTLTIIEYVEPVVTTFETVPTFINIEPDFVEAPIEATPFWDLETTLWFIYGIGVLLLAIRFLINLSQMQRRISNNKTIHKRPFIYVLLEDNLIPHSFFRYIFFNKTRYESLNIPEEVILHEETHAKQLHSIDIIFLEVLQIVFWFHPLIYILKHHIKLNHEFLADQAVLKQGADTKTYQNILLQFSSNTQDYQLTSAINYSSIKKRFTVMKTQTSKTKIWLSSLLVLPIIAVLFYNFSTREYVEKQLSEAPQNSQIKNTLTTEGATEAMMKEYSDWIIQFTNTHRIDDTKYKRIVAIYDIMTETQRNSVELYPRVPNMNLSEVKPTAPTKTQFESWKNKNDYAIWLDGTHISNSKLSNYTVDDIVHYTGSKVHNKARSKKFPQPFQFSLYTKNGFKTNYQESAINSYNEISRTYSEAIEKYLKGVQTDNSELKILKAQVDQIYNQFTNEELEKHNILPAPPAPAKLQSTRTIKPIEIIIKKDNSIILNNKPIKFEDLADTVIKINKALTIEERRNFVSASILMEDNDSKEYIEILNELNKADIWTSEIGYIENKQKTDLPYKHFKLYAGLTVDEAKIQQEKINEFDYESLKNSPLETISETVSVTYIKAEDSKLKEGLIKTNGDTYYFTQQNGKMIYYDKYGKEFKNNNLTPSTPNPKNPSFLDFLEDMESQDATFYLDNKKITAKEAKSITKTNKGKQTEITTKLDENGKYTVLLSTPIVNKKQKSILPIVNGKTIKTPRFTMTLSELKKLKLTLSNTEITDFKFKIPRIKTEQIKGNTISEKAILNLNSAKTGDYISIFDIKDGKDSNISPLVIEIVK